jgi:glutamine synthetase
VLQQPDVIALFDKYNVLSPRELNSRYEIYLEQYIKHILVEQKLVSRMAKTQILPAGFRYQKELALSVSAVKAAGGTPGTKTFETVSGLVADLEKSIGGLESVSGHHAEGGVLGEAKYLKDKVLPAMLAVRAAADALEGIVADDLWPLPKYSEMLFIK